MKAVCARSIGRVKDPLPVPVDCHYCGEDVVLENNKAIYGSAVGNWPYVFRCVSCDAYVGVHPQTKIPLGTLANAELRMLRRRAKHIFHKHQASTMITRTTAYAALARKLSLPVNKTHFGWFDINTCKQVIDVYSRVNSSWESDFER